MPDREKVINALEHCEMCACYDCPYNENGKGGWNCRQMNKDALALLKEQEVKPILIREGKSKMYNDYRCPRCDQEIVYEQNYCCECGSVVKWNDA